MPRGGLIIYSSVLPFIHDINSSGLYATGIQYLTRPGRIVSVEDIFDHSHLSKSFIMVLKFLKLAELVVDSQVDIHALPCISKAEIMQAPDSI